jgi:hypothetical protein
MSFFLKFSVIEFLVLFESFFKQKLCNKVLFIQNIKNIYKLNKHIFSLILKFAQFVSSLW